MNVHSRVLVLTAVIGLLSTACLASFPYNWGGGNEPQSYPEQRYGSDRLIRYAEELENRAEDLAAAISERFDDRYSSWSDVGLQSLYGSEKFLASCRVFLRLAEEAEDSGSRRPRLGEAFLLLSREFDDFEEIARRAGTRTYDLSACADLLRRMDREVGAGRDDDYDEPDRARDEHDDWIGKYAKGPNAAVYLIERDGLRIVRRPFKNLESLFKYNYDLDRGSNPWDYVADVPAEELDRMKIGEPVERTFEGRMVIEPEGRNRTRSVYLIQDGKKRGLTEASLVSRYGGWNNVLEVPKEIIDAYPDGDPIR